MLSVLICPPVCMAFLSCLLLKFLWGGLWLPLTLYRTESLAEEACDRGMVLGTLWQGRSHGIPDGSELNGLEKSELLGRLRDAKSALKSEKCYANESLILWTRA